MGGHQTESIFKNCRWFMGGFLDETAFSTSHCSDTVLQGFEELSYTAILKAQIM